MEERGKNGIQMNNKSGGETVKKNGILNRDINKVLGLLGHTDQITIADAGLPIPEGVVCIDLSMQLGSPQFLTVLDLICKEMIVEKAFVSKEISLINPVIEKEIIISVKEPIEYLNHEDFKLATKNSKVIIRTGENSPFANVILQAGCVF